VGVTGQLFNTPPRDQIGTMIPLYGELAGPRPDILATIGNLLRNAFIRAYLPRLEGTAHDTTGLQFEPGSISDPNLIKGNSQ
jgi:hypothetical protein